MQAEESVVNAAVAVVEEEETVAGPISLTKLEVCL